MIVVRRVTIALALLGCGAMSLSGGGMVAVAGVAAAALLACMVTLPLPTPRALERWRLLNLTLLIVAMILVAIRVPPLSVVAGGLAVLSVHRAATASRPSGLQALLLITALQLMLASAVVSSPWLPVLVGGLVVAGPAVLAVISLQRWHTPTALWGLVAGSVGFLCAALLPPPPGPPVAEEVHAVGFSREISLGDLSPLHDDLTELLTLTVPDEVPEVRYLHGITLDRFTGQGWMATAPPESVPIGIDLVGRPLITQHVSLAPLTEGVLPGFTPIVSVEGLDGAWRDSAGTWRFTGTLRAVRYTAYSLTGPLDQPLDDPGRWLGLPAELDPQIRTLAAERAIEGTPEEQAQHLIDWLLTDFTYTRIPAPQTARQPLSDFLFVTRTGHCEYFAAALAVLLRAQGIPSRVVNGLRGGEVREDGSVLFRQRDAHAWVELYRPGVGWVRLDPTPAAEPDAHHPPALREAAVMPAVPEVELPLLPVAALLFLVGGGVVLYQQLRRDPALALYRSAQRLIRRRGWTLPPSLPPVAASDWLVAHAGPEAEPFRTLAWALYRHRYGEDPGALAEMAAARRLLRRLPKRS